MECFWDNQPELGCQNLEFDSAVVYLIEFQKLYFVLLGTIINSPRTAEPIERNSQKRESLPSNSMVILVKFQEKTSEIHEITLVSWKLKL